MTAQPCAPVRAVPPAAVSAAAPPEPPGEPAHLAEQMLWQADGLLDDAHSLLTDPSRPAPGTAALADRLRALAALAHRVAVLCHDTGGDGGDLARLAAAQLDHALEGAAERPHGPAEDPAPAVVTAAAYTGHAGRVQLSASGLLGQSAAALARPTGPACVSAAGAQAPACPDVPPGG